MNKLLMTTAFLLLSLSSMASSIVCEGQNSPIAIKIDMSGKFWMINGAEYTYKDKVIPTSINEFGIQSDKEKSMQKLVYKFTTLKKHKGMDKNSQLTLTISQAAVEGNDFEFNLSEENQASLKSNDGLIDKMECSTYSN